MMLQIILKYIAHIIAIFSLFQIYLIFFVRREEFFKDLRGKDLQWQLVEISAIIWYIAFPMVVVVSILGVHIDVMVWGSLDSIYVINLGAKRYDRYLELKFKQNENKNSSTNKEIEKIN